MPLFSKPARKGQHWTHQRRRPVFTGDTRVALMIAAGAIALMLVFQSLMAKRPPVPTEEQMAMYRNTNQRPQTIN
ncbi:hypothetical protein PQ455_04890 [Sphingomonas naphthae]|uniref:Energy transducer TonB n=1 Tax=Sphingomonas naphthae TaxID=1813468 RepID=A0ABY7TMV9_9SPHN|nr:hypothetical protein [Sphingomonas naphthae]WCT74568.1 hypothetical protein PQ455_04890 [Sphingomonas naphthae]